MSRLSPSRDGRGIELGVQLPRVQPRARRFRGRELTEGWRRENGGWGGEGTVRMVRSRQQR